MQKLAGVSGDKMKVNYCLLGFQHFYLFPPPHMSYWMTPRSPSRTILGIKVRRGRATIFYIPSYVLIILQTLSLVSFISLIFLDMICRTRDHSQHPAGDGLSGDWAVTGTLSLSSISIMFNFFIKTKQPGWSFFRCECDVSEKDSTVQQAITALKAAQREIFW